MPLPSVRSPETAGAAVSTISLRRPKQPHRRARTGAAARTSRPPSVAAASAFLAALLIASLLLASAGLRPAEATTTIRVPEDYRNIQAAIDAAARGDIIDIAPGTYRGTVLVDKAVTLRGRRFDPADQRTDSTILDGAGAASVVTIPSGMRRGPVLIGLVIANGDDGVAASSPFTIKHSFIKENQDGLDYSRGAGGLCLDNLFVGQGDDAVDFDNLVKDVSVVGNTIRRSADDGIEIRLQDDVISRTAELTVRGNEIAGSREDGIQLIDYATKTNRVVVVRRNLIRNSAMAGIGMMANGNTKEDFSAASIRERVEVFNNTFADNDHGISGGNALIAINNILTGSALALKGVNGRSVASYNVLWANGVNAVNSNLDRSTTVRAAPRLDADFHLKAGSPAIDAGTARFRWRHEVVLDLPPSSYVGPAPDLGWAERR
jgi:hypothetical protein